MKALSFCAVFMLFMKNVSADITYQLYTKMNVINGQPLVYKNPNSVYSSNYNSAKPNKMIIHGYGQDGRANFNRDLKNAFLSNDDYNVIVVDWSKSAGSSYTTARNNVNAIAKSVADFINWMKLDEGSKKLHVIGFDLGAHIAGIAGKNTLNGRIDKITGLDPNRVGFNINQSINRLAAGDARFVEVFHSNGGKIGNMQHVVDSDKYINDGKTQPGCTTDECSHYFAAQVYINQVNGKKYSSYTCESLEELQGKGCGYLLAEWWGEETGLKQIITKEDE